MNAKKIATSVPASQYDQLERVRRRLRMKRSEAVQEALALWLRTRERDDRIASYLRGYTDFPDDAAEGRALTKAWAQGLEPEDW